MGLARCCVRTDGKKTNTAGANPRHSLEGNILQCTAMSLLLQHGIHMQQKNVDFFSFLFCHFLSKTAAKFASCCCYGYMDNIRSRFDTVIKLSSKTEMSQYPLLMDMWQPITN